MHNKIINSVSEVMNFAKAFKENANDMAIGLREAFVKVEMVSVREDLQRRFRPREELNIYSIIILCVYILLYYNYNYNIVISLLSTIIYIYSRCHVAFE